MHGSLLQRGRFVEHQAPRGEVELKLSCGKQTHLSIDMMHTNILILAIHTKVCLYHAQSYPTHKVWLKCICP